MLPLEFLFITVRPVVVMQLRNRGGVLELRIVRTYIHTPCARQQLDSSLHLSIYARNVQLGKLKCVCIWIMDQAVSGFRIMDQAVSVFGASVRRRATPS